jgi:pimeloyl-ACP methyl ester carboxylesterase
VEGAFSREDIARYVEAISRPGALTAALNYYRALRLPGASRIGRRARTDAETLVIWGEKDPALTIGLLDGLDRYAPRVRVHRIPDAGHWIQSEAPAEVNSVLLEFLQQGT